MPELKVCRAGPESAYFVGTCSHVGESREIDDAAGRRIAWMKGAEQRGLQTRVAFLDGQPAGFAYLMPIEISPWGPMGADLAVLPCIWVLPECRGNGAGTALIEESARAARDEGYGGIVTTAYYHDFWFMPAAFFEREG